MPDGRAAPRGGKSLMVAGLEMRFAACQAMAIRLAVIPAIAERLAGGTVEQMQSGTGWAWHGYVRGDHPVRSEPMLHVHAGPGT